MNWNSNEEIELNQVVPWQKKPAQVARATRTAHTQITLQRIAGIVLIGLLLITLNQCPARPAHAAPAVPPAKAGAKCPAGYVWKLTARNAGYGNVIFISGCVKTKTSRR